MDTKWRASGEKYKHTVEYRHLADCTYVTENSFSIRGLYRLLHWEPTYKDISCLIQTQHSINHFNVLTLRVLPVQTVPGDLLDVVLEEELVPGDPLDGCEPVVLETQIAAGGRRL